MLSLKDQLAAQVQDWTSTQLTNPPKGPLLNPCQNPDFGHFQSNVALSSAKAEGKNPRELAQSLADHCQGLSIIETPTIAGPGFVNFRFTSDALASTLKRVQQSGHLGIQAASESETIIFDFSSPNVAKEMHVGHIRSTILGDVLARISTCLGHTVIRDNHIGDWGTQFGKLILGIKRKQPELNPENALSVLQGLYQEINAECDQNPEALDQARAELKLLQDGDQENLRIWKEIRQLSQSAFDSIYEELDIQFDETIGESFYNPWLRKTVDDLKSRNIASLSEGAIVIRFDENDLKDQPFLIQKSDGASLYATTDIATLVYRREHWNPDRIVYVTDGRQQLHFKQLFATAKKMQLEMTLDHVWFGSILGKDKKPLKTREGNPVKLSSLIAEAKQRAESILSEKRPELDDSQKQEMAAVIGIGALKYADLCSNRNLDYVFDWDKMLAFDGNTAPYLLNAYVRTRSILRKANANLDIQIDDLQSDIHLEHAIEKELSWMLLTYPEVVGSILSEMRPHLLCQYLYDVASQFHRFFEHCPVMKADKEELMHSRLQIAKMTGDIIQHGLQLLGIRTLEEM
ncbi:MAG: arginine--tRNA ligase [Verrucomicrobiota bacterium]